MTTVSQRGAVCAAVIVFLAAGLSAAQSWQGRADLEVRVSSRKGGNLAGARVELKYRDGRSGLGPPPVATDGRGRAVILGLAAGTWQVEVKHPDFMSFVAVVRLDAREKPQITASFLEASVRSSAPIQVKLLKAKGGVASPPLRVAATPPPPVKPVPREPTPAPAAEPKPPAPSSSQPPAPQPPDPQPETPQPATPQPSARQLPARQLPAPQPPAPQPDATAEAAPPAPQSPTVTQSPTMTPQPAPAELKPEAAPMSETVPAQPAPEPVAPVQEAPASDPMPAAEPEVVTPAPVMPEPVVEQPEPLPMPTPAPEPAQPEPSIEQPMAEPPKAIAESPEPMPEPTAEAPTTEPPTAETVPEAVISPKVEAPEPAPASPAPPPPPAPEPTWRSYRQRTCPECRPGEWAVAVAANLDGANLERARPCTEDSLDAAALGLKMLGGRGELELAAYSGAVDQAVDLVQGEPSTEIAARLATARLGGCRVLGIALPKGSRFVGFQYEHESASGREPCLPDQACPGGGATFMGPPRITRGAAATVIHALAFGEDGLALMTVFFRAPNSQWAPRP